MSVSLWRWTKDCDSHPCCGDCDNCSKEDDYKLTKEQVENLWESGYKQEVEFEYE